MTSDNDPWAKARERFETDDAYRAIWGEPPKKVRRICRGCGAVQSQDYLLRCDQCNKPLVFPEKFVCPRCKAESYNLHDIVEGYCGRCHAFIPWPYRGQIIQPKTAAEHQNGAQQDDRLQAQAKRQVFPQGRLP
jgi:hypothetical protein